MFAFEELDAMTRSCMLIEFNDDVLKEKNEIYGAMLTQPGRLKYADEMRAAIQTGNESTLKSSLIDQRFWLPTDKRGAKWTPENCADRLCETEFNVFYMRGFLVRLIEEGVVEAEVYRAMARLDEKAGGPAVGARLKCQQALEDLRARNYQTGGVTGIWRFGANTGRSLRRPA